LARKHKHPEHVNHERWLVSYADFITLLFATFTALYALSRSDVDKAKQLAESLRISFGTNGTQMVPMASLDFKAVPSDHPGPTPGSKGKGEGKKQADRNDLENVKGKVESMLMTRKLLDDVKVEVTDRGLVISLKEAGFFESGKAEMKWDAYPILGEIAQSLEEYRNPIRVEGHTDNIPMRSYTYPSNWELSSGRATEVVRLLTGRFGMDSERFSAVGYAEFRPAYSNETAAGRARNRRVDLVVLTAKAETAEAPTEPEETQARQAPHTAEKNGGAVNSTHSEKDDAMSEAELPASPSRRPEYHPALDDWTGSP